MKKAAEELGLGVVEGDLTMKSRYAGRRKAVMIVSDGIGGQAAVVENKDGTYSMVLDNYNNSLVNIAGRDCSILCRGYTTEIVKAQALLMGGVVSGQNVLQDGSVEVRISV